MHEFRLKIYIVFDKFNVINDYSKSICCGVYIMRVAGFACEEMVK